MSPRLAPKTGACESGAPGRWRNWIIAGDGYAYLPYITGNYPSNLPACTPAVWQAYFRLLRVDTSGNASFVPLQRWDLYQAADCSGPYASVLAESAITNSDQGVVVGWHVQSGMTLPGQTSAADTYYLAITSGTNAIAETTDSLVTPVLQAQDGTFYGSDVYGNMVHFDQSANITWSVPGDSPQIATADNGVIGVSGTTYDSSGRATGRFGSLPIQSWTGNGYRYGSVVQTAFTQPILAASFAAIQGGNPSAANPGPQDQSSPAPSNRLRKKGVRDLDSLQSP